MGIGGQKYFFIAHFKKFTFNALEQRMSLDVNFVFIGIAFLRQSCEALFSLT